MSVRALGPALLVDGPDLATLRWALAIAVRAKQRNGTTPGPILATLDQTAAQALAAARQPDTPPPTIPASSEWIGTREIAKRVGCSTRQAQRIARDLDPQVIGGRLIVATDTLTEYLTHKENP